MKNRGGEAQGQIHRPPRRGIGKPEYNSSLSVLLKVKFSMERNKLELITQMSQDINEVKDLDEQTQLQKIAGALLFTDVLTGAAVKQQVYANTYAWRETTGNGS